MHDQDRPATSTMRMRLLAVFLAFAVIGAVAAGTMSTAAQTEDSIAGEYAVTIGREDIPTDLADGFSFAGRWIISFGTDGSYTGERQDVGVVVTGTYELDGDEITITDDTGLVSCANAAASTIQGEDLSSGTYEWAMMGADLTLAPVDDGCGGRVILFSTRTLTIFVPCVSVPLDVPAITPDNGTPVAVEVPDDDDERQTDPLAILTPDEPAVADEDGEEPVSGDTAAIGAEIDELLAQMTACWSTGDPGLWLPLLSEEFRESLVGSSPDFESTIAPAMAVPILWERAGDVDIESPTQVSAIVRATVALEQDFQRFLFVIEDGEWRWDG